MTKVWFRYWVATWVGALVLALYPINTLWLRAALLAVWLGVVVGCFYFGRRRRLLCGGLLTLILLAAVFLSLPGRDFDRGQLRESYIRALRSYEGTKYIWGGENRLGIDCSGLVRAGLMKASFQTGLKSLNPRLVRFSLSLWWHDESAAALGQEYRQLTRGLIAKAKLNELDYRQLKPGDLAVTLNGVHVMAYLGDQQWIEADPDLGKVVVVRIPERGNPWFQETFGIFRWRELDEA